MSKEAMKLEKIMEQAQVFASAWSLVGGRFDNGNMLNEAEAAKKELRQMVAEALAEQPAQDDPDLQDKDSELVEQPAQQEPVATVIGKFLTRKDELRTCIEPELPLGTKLYTTPPAQRKPLTDEDCTRIYNEANGITIKNPPITTERIFKAMRAAHGIKENT